MASNRRQIRPSRPARSRSLLCAAAFLCSHSMAGTAAAESGAASLGLARPAVSRWTLPEPNLRKRAVLLGGSSRMEQVLARQGYIAASPSASVPEPAALYDSPSGYRPAVLDARSETPYVAGVPNLFGSIGIPVASTPLDEKWRNAVVWRAMPASYSRAGAAPAANRMELLRQVNGWVNRQIEFTDDLQEHGQSDLWSSAAESLRRGRGDCEDYAIAKMQMLSALGFSERQMYLVVVRDLVRQADHAVLAVELEERFFILDNMTDEILGAAEVTDYRPIFTYSSSGKWVHGYASETRDRPILTAAGLGGSR